MLQPTATIPSNQLFVAEQRERVSLTPDEPAEASGARVTSCAKVSGPELSTVEKVEVQRWIDNNDSGLRARDRERG